MSFAKLLKEMYIFKDLDSAELEKLSTVASEKTYMAGQEIFMTGQSAECFYLIRMGSVKIFSNTKDGDSLGITQLGTGAHFGEIPFIDGGKRSATAQAVESSQIIEIDYVKLSELLTANTVMAAKIYKSFTKFLASRLRNTTEDLQQAKETKLKHF